MNSVKDSGGLSHWVAPFGDLRVTAFFQLTEAYRRFRVLLRLLMPRHPPVALNSLTKKFDYGPLTKEVLQAVSELRLFLLDAAPKGSAYIRQLYKMKILQASIYGHESL